MSRIRADRVTNKLGTGAPLFPNGIRVVGLTSISNIAASTGTFTGAVSIGGTLTYEDVTNVDSIGIVTARSGIDINAGGLDVTAGGINVTAGGINVTAGVSTLGGNVNIAGNLTLPTSDAKIILKDANNYIQFIDADKNFKFKNNWGAGEFTFDVDGAERIRIGNRGQLGIAGANYGTAGQVFTSGGPSAAPQWATPSGGAWEVVSTTVLSGSTSDLGFNGWSNDYAQYKLVFNDCYHASTTIMRMRYYMDSTSGQNGTLNTTNNYRYTVVRNEFGSNMGSAYGGGGQFGAGASYWNMADLNGTPTPQKMWSGELIFPMKTTAYNQASKAYGVFVAEDYLYNGIGCRLSDQEGDFLTGIHVYWLDNSGSPGARSPSTGRVTLLRMKYA